MDVHEIGNYDAAVHPAQDVNLHIFAHPHSGSSGPHTSSGGARSLLAIPPPPGAVSAPHILQPMSSQAYLIEQCKIKEPYLLKNALQTS